MRYSLTNKLAGQTVVAAVFLEQVLQPLGLLERLKGWDGVLGHDGGQAEAVGCRGRSRLHVDLGCEGGE